MYSSRHCNSGLVDPGWPEFNFGRIHAPCTEAIFKNTLLADIVGHFCREWNGWAKQYAKGQFGTGGFMHAILVADFVSRLTDINLADQ